MSPKIQVTCPRADEADIARTEAGLRGLGLIDSKVDLLETSRKAEGEGLVGFYDPHTQELVVSGTKLDVSTRVIVAHELTHALQDQWFGLAKLQRRADETHSGFALKTLIEGDARRVERDYAAAMTSEDKAAYNAAQSGQDLKQRRAALKTLPPIVVTLFGAPYTLGRLMVQSAVDHGNHATVDGLFKHPPTSDVSFMDPLSLFGPHVNKKVATPKLAKGEKRSGHTGVFGAFPLLLTLSSRIDTQVALGAAEQWAGDSSVQFRRGKTECVRTSFAGNNDAGTKAIGDALTSWSAAWPEGHTKVAVTPKLATLTVCDPGHVTSAAPRDLSGALNLVATRNLILLSALHTKGTLVQAKCMGDTVTHNAELLAVVMQADETGVALSIPDQDKYWAAVTPCLPPGNYNPNHPPGYH